MPDVTGCLKSTYFKSVMSDHSDLYFRFQASTGTVYWQVHWLSVSEVGEVFLEKLAVSPCVLLMWVQSCGTCGSPALFLLLI